MDDGEGNDQLDQFHRNEAISAVADDAFLGEDEDEDYEDLYNDVNVGEGFLQSMKGKSEVAEEEASAEEEAKVETPTPLPTPPLPPPPAPEPQKAPPETVAGEAFGQDSSGFRGNETGAVKGGGIRVELGTGTAADSNKSNEFENNPTGTVANQQSSPMPPPPPQQQQFLPPSTHVVVSGGMGNMNGGGAGPILFVGDLHWWTTDSELETELCKYGQVKEVKFFDEKASGKSKGYCQVEFYDPIAAAACKDGMNGHPFNGRPCVVAPASAYSVKRMGEAQVNRTQQTAAPPANTTGGPAQLRRDAPVKPSNNNIAPGGNYSENNNNNNNNNRGGFARGNWGRGNVANRGGPVMRNHRGGGAMGGRGIMGNGYGANPPMMHPQAMMAQGFDPSYGGGGPMARMAAYGGYPGGPAPPFSGILSSFPPVAGAGLPGVAPHVNPAFFGRGMPMNGMAMMPGGGGGDGGPNMSMWPDPSMSSWGGGGGPGGGGGEDHRAAESSYGEEAGSDHQYGNEGWKEKDRDWSASSDQRRYRDDRDPPFERDPPPREKDTEDWPERRPHREERERGGGDRDNRENRDRERSRDRDRDRERERDRGGERERHHSRGGDDRDRYSEHHHRYKDREADHDDEWDRGQQRSSRSKRDDDHHHHRSSSRSRDADYGKRRRLTSE